MQSALYYDGDIEMCYRYTEQVLECLHRCASGVGRAMGVCQCILGILSNLLIFSKEVTYMHCLRHLPCLFA